MILVGTGGSSGRTLAAVGDALVRAAPGRAIRFVDTQPFNLRTGGTTFYPGPGETVLASPEACGLRNHTGSWSLNMLLNGGPLMYRRMIRYGASLLGDDPEVLVLCHDRIYIETALIHAARARGVPTVLVQEGPFCTIGSDGARARRLRAKAALAPLATRVLRVLPPMPDYGLAGHDLIVAASEQYRQRWIAAGVPAGGIVVGGIPRYDPLAGVPVAAARDAGAPLRVLYLVQPFAAHGKVDAAAAVTQQRALAAGLNQAAARRPLALTIRAHPRSGGDDAAALRGDLAIAAHEDRGVEALEAVLGGVDLVIGHYSSGMLESLMAGRAVVCVPVPQTAFAERREGEKQHWLTTIGIPVATTSAEIAAAVLASDGTPGPVDWARIGEEVGTIDGHAAQHCADAIAELVKRRG